MAVNKVASVLLRKLSELLGKLSGDGDTTIGRNWRQWYTDHCKELASVARDDLEKISIDADNEEEDLDYIKKWVDDYIRDLHRASHSVQSYVLLIERHKQSLEYIMEFMEHDSFFNRFTASKILSQKLNQLYRMLFIRLLGSSSLFKDGGKEFGKLKVPSEIGGSRVGRERVEAHTATFVILEKLRDMLSEEKQSSSLLEEPGYKEMLSEEKQSSSLLEEPGSSSKEMLSEEKQSSSLLEEPGYKEMLSEEKQSSSLLEESGYKEKQSSMKPGYKEKRSSKERDYKEKILKDYEGKEFKKFEVPIKCQVGRMMALDSMESMESGGVRLSPGSMFRIIQRTMEREAREFWSNTEKRTERMRDITDTVKLRQRIIDKNMLENTIDIIISEADFIIHTDEEEIEPIKIWFDEWVDEYIRNIQLGSSSFQSYFDRIKRDIERLEKLDDLLIHSRMEDYPSLNYDSWLTIIIACMILRERECQLWQIFSVDLHEILVNPKVLLDAEYLYYKLEDDLSLLRSIRDADADYRVIGDLTVTNNVIGIGSGGTIVFEGYYHNRLVAIKRLLKTHHSKRHLNEFYEHPNLITFFGMESDRNFYYICLELCMCSLYDLIMENCQGKNNLELWRDGFPSPLLQKLMGDIVSGLAHLHTLKIVLGDLNPQHVLVTKPTSTGVTAKISKIGSSKENMRSLIEDSTGSQTESRWSANVDLFSLGCILFFCITQGKHPYGEDLERHANIVEDNKDLSLIQNSPEAVDLISRLLNYDPELRPKAQEVIHHLFFWDPKTLGTFLQDISKALESEGQNSQLLKTLEGVLGGEKWTDKIDQQFLNERNLYRQNNRGSPYNDSVRDLLRLIRNSLEHYDQFSPTSKGILVGSCPEGVLTYFRSKFPKLFVDVHKVIWEHCAEEERLHGYFKADM